MIPFLGIPVLNRGDLLERCVRSIDYPVGRLIIVNNGKDEGVLKVCGELIRNRGPLIGGVYVHFPHENLGVAGSWNFLMDQAMDEASTIARSVFGKGGAAEYGMLAGNDIQLAPGDLAKMHEFTMGRLDHAMFFGNHGYSLFNLTRKGWEGAGRFDENIYPAYLEDCDHFYRVKLAGLPSANVPEIHAVHGEAPSWGSSTIHSDPEMRRKNGTTHGRNFQYYIRKWGGENGREVYTRPFNNAGLTWKDWTFNAEWRVGQKW